MKIFGERNSATNALRQLIEANSGSTVVPSTMRAMRPRPSVAERVSMRLGTRAREQYIDLFFSRRPDLEAWKHCATDFDRPDVFRGCFVVFCVRHPASWVLSLKRRPYNALGPVPDDFDEFLRMDWRTAGRERLRRERLRPLDLHTAKVESYLAFERELAAAGVSTAFVRFEDFVVDQTGVFRSLAADLDSPNDDVVPIRRSTNDSRKDAGYYARYYGGNEWLAEIPATSIATINDNAAWELLERFDYHPLEAEQPSRGCR